MSRINNYGTRQRSYQRIINRDKFMRVASNPDSVAGKFRETSDTFQPDLRKREGLDKKHFPEGYSYNNAVYLNGFVYVKGKTKNTVPVLTTCQGCNRTVQREQLVPSHTTYTAYKVKPVVELKVDFDYNHEDYRFNTEAHEKRTTRFTKMCDALINFVKGG